MTVIGNSDVNFTASTQSGSAPLTVTFTDASAPGGTAYEWEFGDGQTGTGTSVSHTYTTDGEYDVKLKVTYPDPVGDQTTEKEKFIKVAVANCTAPKLSGFKYNDAQAEWTKAKFTGTVSKDTGAPNGNFVITAQSVVYTSVVPVLEQRQGLGPVSATFGLRRRRGGTRQRGQALVEFALVIPIFLLLLVSLFDMGRAVFSYNTLTNAAREGARMAIVNQDVPTIIERAKRQSALIELNDPSVSVAFYQMKADGTADMADPCNLVAVGCLAVVSFEATYVPITPIVANIVFGSGVTMRAESVLSVEYRCPNDDPDHPGACPKQP